ncbi:hypothetical protein LR48_Vigan09g115800 [Vigna angularis]|uniref:Uncharacterized protein n=1 Tax=Phaseolus angularis TaxID=3914 RepID=A0A0L9VCY2_PHAAN|nr:hypothetical protein LR48_Vigan09g115800 [Vigna angularis]
MQGHKTIKWLKLPTPYQKLPKNISIKREFSYATLLFSISGCNNQDVSSSPRPRTGPCLALKTVSDTMSCTSQKRVRVSKVSEAGKRGLPAVSELHREG